MGLARHVEVLFILATSIANFQLVRSLTIEYCAGLNTGSTPTNSSIWQSNGLCHDYCVDQEFALAIVQKYDCWCSNYIPAKSSQVDSDECNDPCPGWEYETCGADGLYGYIALGLTPSGTAEASSSSTSTPTGQISTSSVEASSAVTSAIHSPATSTSTTSSTSHGTNTKTTTTASPTTSVRTVTAGGTVSLETVTVTPTAGVGAEAGNVSSNGPTAGAIAGIVIGVLGVVGILAGLAVFLYLHRRKRQREEEITSRPHSHLSGSVGVMSTPTTAMASVWDGDNTSTGRRNSRLMPHDPRMDPFATNIYSRFENKSRESINTLQDNQDYSRKVLRTTNPDPPDE